MLVLLPFLAIKGIALSSRRSLIDKTFSYHRLSPSIVLSAIDSDVIKAYVELG